MILTSTSAPERFTPLWRKDATPPVYLIRAGSVTERAAVEAELSGPHRAGKVWGFELVEAVRSGVEALLADDPGHEHVLELLDQEQEMEQRTMERLAKGGEPKALLEDLAAIAAEMGDVDQRTLVEVRQILAQHWGPYRDLLAQQARRRELAPIVALRRFLVGFENVDATFARDRDGMVSEATLAAIDPLELTSAGNHAYSLLFGGGQKRPLAPPSPSAGGPATSNAGASPEAGKSPERRGRRTRV